MEETKKDNDQESSVENKDADTIPEETEISAEEVKKMQELDEETIIRMQQELEEAKSQSEAATDMMLRLAAELDNYKKRTVKERESLVKYAAENIIRELLPVLDNFERAIESANESRDFDSFHEGVKMIFSQMYSVLEKEGVRKIEAIGKAFDPTYHEAIMQMTSNEYPENTIIEEHQKGYILHDRVIRPSMVVVSRRE